MQVLHDELYPEECDIPEKIAHSSMDHMWIEESICMRGLALAAFIHYSSYASDKRNINVEWRSGSLNMPSLAWVSLSLHYS